jgi:predicted phage terminase large subunit-like protein
MLRRSIHRRRIRQWWRPRYEVLVTAPARLSPEVMKRKQLGTALALAAQLVGPQLVDEEEDEHPIEIRKPELTLREFIAEAWRILEPGRRFVGNWHIDAVSDHLQAVSEGHIRRLLINIPPRHMKSLTVDVFWPAWEWTYAPHMRYIFGSYAQKLATRDSVKCRRLIESKWYRSRWGHIFSLSADQNEKMRFENDRTGYRIATSVSGGGTGEGADRIVFDDPHKVKEAESETQREGVIDWWDETMSTRMNDPATVAKVGVMQRVHGADLAGHIIEQGGWDHLCLPARYETKAQVTVPTSIGFMDPRTEEGEILWKTRFDDAALKQLESDLGSMGAAAQLQQRPAPKEGAIMKREWFEGEKRTWRQLPAELLNNAPGADWLLSVDCAFKDTDGSDFVVVQTWARWGAFFYVVWQEKERLSFTATCTRIVSVSNRFPHATLKLVEDKANGPAVIDTLRAKIPGLVPIEPYGSKEARMHAASPIVEAGNVILPDPSMPGYAWVHGLIDELCLFPRAANDDQCDAFTQAVKRLNDHLNSRDSLERMARAMELDTFMSDAVRVTRTRY